MVIADQVALRQLPIDPDGGLPQRFSFALGASAFDVAVYAHIDLGVVSTTASTLIEPGSATVMPSSMLGIEVGSWLSVDTGARQENLIVTGATTISFTASFQRPHGPGTYLIKSAVSRLDPPETVYDLAPPEPTVLPATPPGFLVVRVARARTPAQPIFLGKVVVDPALVHEAGEIGVVVKRARVARGNLNGHGHFGTDIVIGVGNLWA